MFLDTHYWMDLTDRRNALLFSKNLSLAAMHNDLQWNHLFCTPQPRLIWVCLQQLRLFLLRREKVYHCYFCVCTGIVIMKKRPWSPVFGQHWHTPWRHSADSGAHTSHGDWLTVLRRNGVNMAKCSNDTGNHFLCALHDLLSFGGGISPREVPARLLTASWLPDHINRSKFDHFPCQFWIASTELSQHELGSLSLILSLSLCHWMGDPPCTSFSDTKMIRQCEHGHCRSDTKIFPNLSSWFGNN